MKKNNEVTVSWIS